MRFARTITIGERAKRESRPSSGRPLCTMWCNPTERARKTRRSPMAGLRHARAHCQARIAEKFAHSPSRSPRCTSAPLPWRWAPRASTHGNDSRSGWLALAMAIVRNSSRRQRVSVYKHCKVTHRRLSSPPSVHPRSLQTAESRYVTKRAIVATPRDGTPNSSRKFNIRARAIARTR